MAKRVYLEYDQRALDAEYNNREKVKDSADWISRYAIASAETRATLECRLDLAYGVPKHHHFSILAELEDPGSTLSRLLLRQMGFR